MGDEDLKWKPVGLWFLKNSFTVLGIVIILVAAFLTVGYTESKVNECNQFWHEQTKRVCPALYYNINNIEGVVLDDTIGVTSP